MKHSTLISLTAAVSLAACNDATVPRQPQETIPDAPASAARADNSAAWATVALDDAATRLLSTLAEGPARDDLKRALHALSARIASGDNPAAIHAYRDQALDALARLRAVSDPSAVPDVDAIGLALDGAASLLDGRQNK